MKRLFIGVPLSDELKKNIRSVAEAFRKTDAGLAFVAEENLHFTLKFLGAVEEKEISTIQQKLGQIAQKQKKINLEFAEVGVFPTMNKINVIWLGIQNQELPQLIQKIHQQLNYIHREEREEIPHLTIARVKSAKNKEKLQDAVQEWKHKKFGTIVLEKFILYESTLTPQGPRYAVVEEYKLV